MTKRAQALLKTLTWQNVLQEKSQIVDAFEHNHIKAYDTIIDFQLNFGGLTFYTGLEPIVWGIHHLTPRGEFKNSGEEIIDFIHEDEYPEFSLLCADTLCQIRWTIDDKGAIFEDFDLLTNSFEKMLEDYALRSELINENKTEIFKGNIFGKSLDDIILNFDNIQPLQELQEPGIKWFKFDNECFLVEYNKELMVIGPKFYDTRQRIEILERLD